MYFSKSLVNSLLIKIKFTLLSMSLLHVLPTGPVWRDMLVSRAFLYISLRDPGRGALKIVTCLSKSPVKDPPPYSPNGATYGERCPFPEPYFTNLFTQRKEEPHFRPTDPSLSPLSSPRAVCKPDKTFDLHRIL